MANPVSPTGHSLELLRRWIFSLRRYTVGLTANFLQRMIPMAKRLFQKVARTSESLDVEYIESDMTEAELAEDAGDRIDDVDECVDDVYDEVNSVNDGMLAVESLLATCRLAKKAVANNGSGFDLLTVESLNASSRTLGAILRANGPIYTLNKSDFATKAQAIAATTKLAKFSTESLFESINSVMEASAIAVDAVAAEVGEFMTSMLKTVDAQNVVINDIMARVHALTASGAVSANVTSTDLSLAHVVLAAHHHDIIAVLETRSAVLADIVDNIQALPENALEHILDTSVPNPFASALATVYTPLMDGFDKVSQDTIPFVESGLSPDEWTPYMSKSFGIDGNAAMISINIPFMQLALGESTYDSIMDFTGTWFMECDITGGAASDVTTSKENDVLDVVEMESYLSRLGMNILSTSDNLVEAAASMSVYMKELKRVFAEHDQALIDSPNVMVGMGMIVDFSEYLANVAVKAIGHAVADTDRILQACAVSIEAIKQAHSLSEEKVAASKVAKKSLTKK